MAGSVATKMTLQDKMLAGLKKQLAAVDDLCRGLDQMSSVIDGLDSGAEFLKTAEAVKATAKPVEDLVKETEQASQEAEHLNDVWSKLGKLLTLGGLFQLGRSAFGLVQQSLDDMNVKVMYQTQLATVMGNQGNDLAAFDQIQARAEELSKTTTYGSDAFLGGAAELATYLQDADAVDAMLGTLSNYAAGMAGVSVDAKQMVDLATQLGKALDGTFDGLQKKGFVLTDAQKEMIELGSDMEKVQTITDVIDQSWAGLAEAFANTPQGKIQQLANSMGDVRETIGGLVSGGVVQLMTMLNELAMSPGAQMLVNSFAQGVNKLTGLLSGVIGLITWLTSAIAQGWVVIEPLLWGVATVIGIALIPQIQAMIASTRVAATQAWGLAAAWITANSTMLVGAIAAGAAVATLGLVFNLLGITVADVLGLIGGLIGGLITFILNRGIGLMNNVIAFVEFLVNVFQNPVHSIKKLFADLFDSILGIVEDTAALIDSIFKTDFASHVAGFRDTVKDWVGEMPEGYKVLQRMEELSVVEGAEFGAGIGRNLAGMLDGVTEAFKVDPTEMLDHIGTVDEVGRIKDDVNIAEEDIKLLRDVAEQRFVQNFVSLRTGITMSGTTITKEADADQVMARINDRLTEEQESSAKGVYKMG